MAHPQERHMGEVLRLPLPEPDKHQRPATGQDDAVDGELVPRPGTELTKPKPTTKVIEAVGRLVRAPEDGSDAPPVRRGAKATGVAVYRVARGHQVWARQAARALTYAVIREQITAARAVGDSGAVAEWTTRLEQAKAARRERLLAAPAVVLAAVRAALLVVVILAGVLLMLGVTVHLWAGGWTWSEWWAVVGGGLSLLGTLTTWTITLGLLGAPVGWAIAAYRAGGQGELPAWADTPAAPRDGTDGRTIHHDAGSILEALRYLRLAELNDAFRAGWASPGSPMQVWEQEPHRDGLGIRCQIRLPKGVSVEAISRKRTLLAHNLVRKPVEVWPTEPRRKAAVLDLWIADPGALTGPVPAWPILDGLQSYVGDYFRAVPVGVSIRGDVVKARLFEANYAFAGLMGSGKSTLAITLLLGAILDPLVEADVFVMARNADYEPMEPRLRTLVTGSGQETIEAAMTCLREAYADLDERGRALGEHDARAVTRELAERDARLRPRVILVDECQALFMDEEYGEEAADLAVKLISAARKYALTLMFLTPEPSSTSLPRRVMTVTSCKACFAIGDQQSNDAILGTGSYKAGISAVGLQPKTDDDPGDVGTAMTRGFMATPGLMRCYFIDQATAHRVTARALAIREQAGIVPVARQATGKRDLLEDLDAVLGVEDVPAADVPALLARHAPGWAPYRSLTGKALVAQLAKLGVKVPSTGNRWPVRPEVVRAALARQSTADLDDE